MTASPIYAVGDIHGCRKMLDNLLDKIREDARSMGAIRPKLVFLGDYIDRGRDSQRVIDLLMGGIHGFDTVCLLGNHEELMLNCTISAAQQSWEIWLLNGGFETLDSFGYDMGALGCDADALSTTLGAQRLAWLNALPRYHVEGEYLFVHAGIVPGVPLDQQAPKDLIWIRDTFLNSDTDHGYRVIHGHTSVWAPDMRPNRINVDTSAVQGGSLTAVVLMDKAEPRFLSVTR